jgi:hypothetical protein
MTHPWRERKSCIVPCSNCLVVRSDIEFIDNKFLLGICSTQMKIPYTAGFKLNVINYVKEHGNRITERHFVPPLTEKMVYEW